MLIKLWLRTIAIRRKRVCLETLFQYIKKFIEKFNTVLVILPLFQNCATIQLTDRVGKDIYLDDSDYIKD